MKRLTLFFWGRSVLLGCVLAGLAGTARAQTGSSATLESKDFDLTMDTLRQTGSLQQNMPQYEVTFRLDNDAILTNRSVIGLEVNFVPPTVQLSGITLYDPTGQMTADNFESGAFATLTGGAQTFTATGMVRGSEAAKVTFRTEEGERAATPVTFIFGESPEIQAGVTYTLRLNWAGVQPPALMAFDNAATVVPEGGSRGDFAIVGGTPSEAPHMAFSGTAFINRFVLQVTGEASLSSLLDSAVPSGKTFVDDYDTASTSVVAEMRSADASLSLDQSLTTASFVAASFVKTDSLLTTPNPSVPTVTFVKDVPMTGPFSLRGGTEKEEGATPLTADICLSGDTSAWVPKSFMLRSDLWVDCHIPTSAGWFKDNVLPIASGRRIVLKPSDYTEDHLPNVAFEAADSALVLAGQDQTGDIPLKYQELLGGSSGMIAFARDAEIFGADTESSLTIGREGLTQTLLLLTEGKTLTASKPMVVGSGAGADGTLRQHAGTLTLGDATFTTEGATRGRYLQDAGTATMGTVTFAADGGNVSFQVGDGSGNANEATTTVTTLTSGTGGGAATLEVLSDGRLVIGEKLNLSAANQSMTLRGGTLAAGANKAVRATFTLTQNTIPQSDAETLHVEGGGTLDGNGGSLTLSAVSGNGELTAKGQVTIETLWAYDGTVQAERSETGANKLTIEKILGSTGTVTVGYLGYRKDGGADDDAAALEAVTKAAAEYHGTLAFTDQYAKKLDFSVLRDVIDFPYALDFSQMTQGTITMRLDQYVETTVRWPANCGNITLNLIESGAYGGEAVIPTFPGTIHFKRYNPEGGGLLEADVPVTVTPNENGVTSDVTWNPSFTGQGAWIDVEFDGTSRNTGWFTLKGEHGEVDDALYNGLLLGNGTNYGPDNARRQVVMTDKEGEVGYVKGVFVKTGHPVSKGVKLYSRPYVSYSSLTYPEAFSVVLRVMTPNVGKKCILQLGANHTSDGAGSVNGKTDSLVFATGNSGNHLVVWLVRGNSETGAMTKVAEAELANATTAAHVVSVVFDGQKFRTYLDGALLTTYTPDTAVELGTGLQVGAMLGQEDTTGDQSVGFVNRAIWAELGPVEETDSSIPNYTCGVLDYIRFYKGVLTDKAMEELTKASPPVLENVRFVRDVPGSSDFGLWVGNEQNKPWTKETWNGSTWTTGDTYAEPEEGAEIRLRVTEAGVHLLQVNVARDTMNRFYSTDRLYSTLVVEPKAGAAAGTVRLVPVGVTSADYEEKPDATAWITNNEWYTTPATKDDAQAGATFHYGRLRFLGGAKDPIHADTTISNFYGAGYLLPSGTTGVTGIFDAGVCWFSELAPFYLKATGETQPNVLQLVAGLSLTRGVDDESRTWQLTGPVTVEGTQPNGTDPVQGNTAAETAQASQDVWVAAASDAAKWTFFDRTLTEGGETNGNGETKGLFAQGLQTPGRLYLDLTDQPSKTQYTETQGVFSAQKWYRYGYPGAGTATPSGMEPKEASENDFALAIAFQVRLPEDATVATLNMDKVPTAKVQTFFVEPVAAPADGAVAPTLRLKSNGTTQLTIQKSVIVRTPLDVSNVGKGEAKDSLALAQGVEIHRGDALKNGKYYGAYITGNQTFNWPLGVSSVPRLEVAPGGLVTLSGAQDLHTYQTVLAVSEGATLRQDDAENTLRAAGLELGEGATFAFKSTATDGGEGAAVVGVQLDGNLTLTGNATLSSEATGNTVFSAAAFRGPTASAILTLNATDDATTWRIPTVDWTNLGLTKTGPGTVDFSGGALTPPTVSGPIRVEKGTLRVALAATSIEDTGDAEAHHGEPGIGHSGLYVATGATLAGTEETASGAANHVLACIPSDQTLSGGGRIEGLLRLWSGATYDATEEMGMTVRGVVVDDLTGANVTVKLPETYEKDTVYLTAQRSETMVRRRLNSQVGGTRWDTIAKITNGATTEYSARPAGVPVPSDPFTGTGNVYDGDVADLLTRYYRDYGVAYLGSAEGLTKAKTYALNAGEIGNVLQCFTGVWTFSPYTADDVGDAVYVDAQKLCVAYEFGISRLTIAPLKGDNAPEGLYVIAEVKVEQALKGAFGENVVGGDQVAAFVPKVTFTFFRGEEEIIASNVTELKAFDGTVLPTGAEEPTGPFRYFAIPYTEVLFPKGTTTDLRVQVKAPEQSSTGTR